MYVRIVICEVAIVERTSEWTTTVWRYLVEILIDCNATIFALGIITATWQQNNEREERKGSSFSTQNIVS